MAPSLLELLGTIFFCFAVLHTFLAGPIHRVVGKRFRFLGEVELVFGFWALLLLAGLLIFSGPWAVIGLLKERSFFEPAFVFVIMILTSTRFVRLAAAAGVRLASERMPLPGSKEGRFYFTCLALGPLLGSLISEPAAMTVTARLMSTRYFGRGISERFKYATLGALFVNVSVGGVLTPYAAPPVLMVARKWNWDLAFMLSQFGWKAVLICVLSAGWAWSRGRRDLKSMGRETSGAGLGKLAWRESLGVACFLSGLVVLGDFQRWWLEPLLGGLDRISLFLGSAALTSVVDNAALTYLGSQVPALSDSFKYALVAGSVAGGGLTIIANAPNPAGFAILKGGFGEKGIQPLQLLLGALVPTLIAVLVFGVL